MINRFGLVLLLSAVFLTSCAERKTAKAKPPAPAPTTTAQAEPPEAPSTTAGTNFQLTPKGQVPVTGPAEAPLPRPAANQKPDRAAAYYHFSMAHIYEELVSMYGRGEYAQKAIDEYRAAIAADPSSEYLDTGLAELYAKTGRIRDAVLEAQDLLKRDPKNVDAHKLLGRIYLRSLGDMQSGTQSQQVLKLAIDQYEQIVQLEPNEIDNHLLLGRLYRLNNDMGKAESEFKTAAKIDPDSEEAVSSLAYLYTEEGDMNKAIATLNSVPETDRSAKVYAALGYTYEQQKDYKKAIDAYQHAVDLDHDNLDSVRGLAQNLMNDGQMDAALAQYKTITDADPQDAQAYLRIAEIYRHMGKFDAALESLKKAESLVQDSLEVPYNIALVYEAQGRYQEAAQKLQDLLQKTEKSNGNYSAGEATNRAIFLERLGNIYREMQNTPMAVDTFRKMIPLGDDNASRAYQEMVESYRDAKDWNQATAAAQEGVNKLPKDRTLKLVYASQLADQGQADAGLNQVKSLLKGTPDDREIYIALAQMYTRLRRWPEAEVNIEKAEKLSTKPDDIEYAAFVHGSIYERQKRYDEAESMFKRVLQNDPRNAVALNYLGYMLADRGTRLEEALGYIKKAVDLDPQNGAYLDSLGWVYFKMGNYDLAEVNLRKASERTNDGTIQDHLAELYHKTGRLKLAVVHWERALTAWNHDVSADVDPSDVARVQKDLETTRMRLAQQQTAPAHKDK